MPQRSAPADLLADLAGVLRRWGDRWYVFGAQAVLIWGRPRMTADVDVTVALVPPDTGQFVRDMQTAGFELRVGDVDDFVRRTHVLPFVHSRTQMPLDIVLAASGLEKEFLDRARRARIGDLEIPVISPEDLIIAKILAGRPQDLEDIAGILARQKKSLDAPRIRETLKSLESALAQSDLVPAFERLLELQRH